MLIVHYTHAVWSEQHYHVCKGIIVNIAYQSLCPFIGIGSPPPQPARVSPLDPKGEEQHSLAGEGMGGPNSDGWKESLAL